MSDSYDARFSGIGRLYGLQGMERLAAAQVCVIGVGGVGSWTVEALARSGVGHLTLVDLDDVCVYNTNRQLHALDGNVGRQKVEVLAERVQRINPECEVEPIADFFTRTTAEHILERGFDYVVDGIDAVNNKCLLISLCRARSIPVVVVGGAGGRRDPGTIRVGDLNQTQGDGLLRRIRKNLRKNYDFPRHDRRWGIPTVFSDERPVFPTEDGGVCDTPGSSERTELRLDCNSGYGTATFVTGTFGFMAAGVVVSALADPPAEVEKVSVNT